MKTTRRILVGAACVAAASLALSACAGSSSGGGSADKVQLTMLVNITPNLTEGYWKDLVAPFEKANPNITVKIQAPATEGVKATLPQLLASGQVPDIVETLTPTKELAPELVDLSQYDWAKKAPLADQYTIDGKYLSAGTGMQLQTVWFYNKKAFADAGITDVPKTTAEFDADLGKLKAAGWTPIQSTGEWATQMAFQFGGLPAVLENNPKWWADMSSGKLTFSKSYADMVDRYATWVSKGYIPKDSVGLKYADGEQQFLAGKTALYPMGSWFAASEAKATAKPEIGVFSAPADTSGKPKQGASVATPYIIMKATKHQDAAAKLVEFLVTDKTAVTKQLEVDGNFRSGYEYKMDDLGTQLQKIVAATDPADFAPTGDGFGSLTVPVGYQEELNTQVQGLLTGGSTDAMKKAMDDWFASNR
jgi:multiple sugar transport system substrate-binding protein/raffinose/stachyose/melibiose transport system substrate-binding protein